MVVEGDPKRALGQIFVIQKGSSETSVGHHVNDITIDAFGSIQDFSGIEGVEKIFSDERKKWAQDRPVPRPHQRIDENALFNQRTFLQWAGEIIRHHGNRLFSSGFKDPSKNAGSSASGVHGKGLRSQQFVLGRWIFFHTAGFL
jgi:hypothetical protein